MPQRTGKESKIFAASFSKIGKNSSFSSHFCELTFSRPPISARDDMFREIRIFEKCRFCTAIVVNLNSKQLLRRGIVQMYGERVRKITAHSPTTPRIQAHATASTESRAMSPVSVW
jgi:hypothetical protein